MPAPNTRRTFLRRTGAAAAALALPFPTILPSRARGAAPSEQIRLGFIGVGNQGLGNLKAFLKHDDALAVAVCDVDSKRRAIAQGLVTAATRRECAALDDYRKLLDRQDVDAVVVTTPDHWHARPTVDACAAGKDVYCEKPLTLTVAEGLGMVKAARDHKRIVQTGSQQRSDDKFRKACELVRSGKLGKLKLITVGLPGVNFEGPPVPDTDPPAELDYNFWLGPAPDRPYNPKRVHYNFRFFWDYSGGQMTNWGAHHLDIVQWALGRDDSGPSAIEGTAHDHPEHWYEVPQTSALTFTYPDGVTVRCLQGGKARNGVLFEGSEGTLFVTRGKIEATPAEILRAEPDTHLYVSKNHHQNWLDCIKSREAPICDVAIGHRSATVCHLGNIALRLGRKVAWDPDRQQIANHDTEAADMLRRPYRAPWQHPEV